MSATRKFAIVTGASTGIGFELAKRCAKEGYDLLIAADEAANEQAAAARPARPGADRTASQRHCRRLRDRLFVKLMTFHHAGAVKMADAELRTGSDPRLRVMAHAIRHEQQGEIALMNCIGGVEAVRLAIRNIVADNVNAAEPDAPRRTSCRP